MAAQGRLAWIDASAGVAGDMLLGALLDAGARLEVVQAAVDAVVSGAARLRIEPVTRAGLRATKLHVGVVANEGGRRDWAGIRRLLEQAELAEPVRRRALSVFGRLADAEARVHGIAADDVHFHEVGALDSIADIVGSCAALDELGVTALVGSPIAVGSGVVRTEHGELAVPVPAVAELAHGWSVVAGGIGELATPTGVALLTTLAAECGPLPALRVEAVGVGAGSRDPAGRANVVRVVVGEAAAAATAAAAGPDADEPADVAVVIEANIDDLDPRLWPGVLAALLAAGASDAWLSPIVMKKGRPAHTLHVLAPTERMTALRHVVLEQTTTMGVRETAVRKYALPRAWVPVEIPGGSVRVKVADLDGLIVQATPEFDDAEALAARLGVPVRDVLAEVGAAAARLGLTRGAAVPGWVSDKI